MQTVKPLSDDAFLEVLRHTLATGLGPKKQRITVDVVSDPN